MEFLIILINLNIKIKVYQNKNAVRYWMIHLIIRKMKKQLRKYLSLLKNKVIMEDH